MLYHTVMLESIALFYVFLIVLFERGVFLDMKDVAAEENSKRVQCEKGYRWAVFILLILGLILLMKHKVLTPFVFWSRIQYYTFSTFTLFVVWLGATLFQVDVPFLYTADCRYIVAASLGTLSLMYHLIVRPGAIRTHKLNDISYEHFSFYNYIFHYFIPILMLVDYIFFVDSDDWIETDAAESIALCARETDADLIYFGFFKEKKRKTVVRCDRDFSKAGKMEFIKALYTGKTYGYNVIKCFRRSLFLHEPFYWPRKWMLDDRFLVTQLLFFSRSMARLEKPLYHYRRDNPNAVTRQKRALKRLDASINMMDLYLHYRDSLADSPIQDVYGNILYYCAWNALRYNLPLFEIYPQLRADVKRLPVSRKNIYPIYKQLWVRFRLR